MKHRTTPTGAFCAVLFLAFAATPAPAAAAPKDPPPKAAMQTMALAAKPAPAPAPTPAAASTGRATAGSSAPAPMADPGPSKPPAPAGGATTSFEPGGGDSAARDDRYDRRRRNLDDNSTGIFISIAFFLCILLLVGTIQYMGLRKDRNKHQTLQLMVEKGAQIPVELITSQKRQGSDLRRGLVLVGAGLGITLFLLMTQNARSSGFFGLGLIPALIGGGYLLAWKLEGRKLDKEPRPTATYANGGDFTRTQPDELDVGEKPE